MSEKEPTVSPDEVADFIAGKGKNFFGVKIKTEEVSEEVLDKIKQATSETVEQEKVDKKSDLPMPAEFDKALPTVAEDNFTNQRLDELLGKVKVTELDKDLYMKALLNDTPFETEVSPIKGISLTIKSRTMYEDEFVFHAMDAERKSGQIIGPETYFSRLQLFLACVQVRKIGTKVVEFNYEVGEPFDELHKRMVEHINALYLQMQSPKWNAIVAAVRLFEAKLKICNDNLRDENFWIAAGID